jgi:hypothetical protein
VSAPRIAGVGGGSGCSRCVRERVARRESPALIRSPRDDFCPCAVPIGRSVEKIFASGAATPRIVRAHDRAAQLRRRRARRPCGAIV